MNIEYCWRVDKHLPMLNEEEWEKLSPLLTNTIKKIKAYRTQHGCDIPTARARCSPEAVEKFEELTGYRNMGYDVMFYLRRSSYGPKCKNHGVRSLSYDPVLIRNGVVYDKCIKLVLGFFILAILSL